MLETISVEHPEVHDWVQTSVPNDPLLHLGAEVAPRRPVHKSKLSPHLL